MLLIATGRKKANVTVTAMLIVTGDCDWDVAWPEAVAVIQRIKRVRAAQLALVCAAHTRTHAGHICEAVSVCVYLLNTSEILYPYLVFACVEACFAIASAFPAPLTYFSGIFTCCRRVVQRKLMPLVYMCVCVYLQLCICVSFYLVSLRESVFFAIVQIIQRRRRRRRHQGGPTTFVTICSTQCAATPRFCLSSPPLFTVLLH